MKEIVVLSGKGGTGKTSITACLAALAPRKVLVDCDVDAADLHLVLNPSARETREFRSGQTACIEPDKCVQCSLCRELCRFNAIENFTVDPISCEGCGFCAHACPVSAIEMRENLAGHWFVSDTRYGALVHARLGVAQENSGKLVATVREKARKLAEDDGTGLIISDGPPGIGCPVISSLSGASLALMVTEPTLSGIHDLERIIMVAGHFNVPAVVCINKYDINEDNTRRIEEFCRERGIEVIAKIPFDNAVTEAMIKGVPVTEYGHNRVSSIMKILWHSISKVL